MTHLLAERNRLAPLASVLTHGALVLFVLGMGFVTPRFGYETSLKVPVGEVRPTGLPADPETVLVGNDGFVAEFDEAGSPVDYRTTLVVYRDGRELARKEVRVNDPLSTGSWAFHENFFGPAVEVDLRDRDGQILYSGSVILDGQLAGKPEGLLRVPNTDVAIDLILSRGEGDVAELSIIGARPPRRAGEGPEVLFGAVLRTGDGYFAENPGVGIEFRRPTSYIGLIAKRDPGQGLIWLGGVLLVAGLATSLLAPRRRVWARYDRTTVRLAVVGGDPFTQAACDRFVTALPAAPVDPAEPAEPSALDRPPAAAG